MEDLPDEILEMVYQMTGPVEAARAVQVSSSNRDFRTKEQLDDALRKPIVPWEVVKYARETGKKVTFSGYGLPKSQWMYNLRGIKECYHMYDDDYYAGNFVVSFDPTSNVIKTLYLYDLVVDLENQKPKNNIKRYEKTVVSDDAVVKAMYPFFYSLLYASPDKDYDEQPEEIRDCGVSKVSIRVIGDAEFIDTGRKVYYGRSLKVSNLFFDREVIDYILRKRVKDTHVLDVEPYVSKLYEEPPSFITKSFGML